MSDNPDPRLDEIQAIPAEAVEAAAEWLPHSDDCEARPERDCTCWQPRVNLMREALEAAAPYIQSAALDEGWDAGMRFQPNKINPYRTAK